MDLSNDRIIHVKNGNVEYIQFRRLLEYSNKIRHCYSMICDYKVDNGKNYKNLCLNLGLDYKKMVRIDKQVHSNLIDNVYKEDEKHSNVDGLITNKKGICLALRYADCMPILLYDVKNNIIANVHSGWKGTSLKIGQKAVLKMISEYGSELKDIICCFGPCIAKCHFKVSEDVKEIFDNTFGYMQNEELIQKGKIEGNEQKYYIDINLVNRLMLEEIGIVPENIIESNLCTVCNSSVFHSYRKNGEKAGRNTAIIGLI